jgi:Domain of unknown function (DUF3303)
MRFLMKMEWQIEAGNAALKDPKFGDKVMAMLKEMKAEAAYFTTINGNRGGYIVINMDDASQMVAMAEPVFFGFKAKVEYIPVMLPQDLAKGMPAAAKAIKEWA